MKKALLIAFHYPPVGVSSGLQRTLKNSQYLPEFDWQPMVLTVDPKAYEQTSSDQMAEVPEQVLVKRAFGRDAARHFAFRGKYFEFLALPDRWASWVFGGVLTGLGLIRKQRPALIWSTFPIATAHLIGLVLHRITGLPWVADFRDSMTEDHYPSNPRRFRCYRWIEGQAVRRSARIVCTAPSTIRMYQQRYPDVAADKYVLIPNGYDEENFARAEAAVGGSGEEASPGGGRRLTLVHSGILYPSERDPRDFFAALVALRQEGRIGAGDLHIVLRATGHDGIHRATIEALGLQDMVTLAPTIAYEEALQEMLTVDGLLVFQASNCNHQIPAKIYEYLRARKPILALTDPLGDTAHVLSAAGINFMAPLDDQARIRNTLLEFVDAVRSKAVATATEATVQACSRKARTQRLAQVFDAVAAEGR